MRYVGLDVHWRQSTICVLDTRGRKLSTQTIKGSWSKVLEELGRTKKPFSVCFEASTRRARIDGRSPGIVTSTVEAWRVPRSSSMRSGPFWKTISPSPLGPGPIDGIIKLDRATGGADVWDAGAYHIPNEPIFVPVGNSEDAGYLVSMVFDRTTANSYVAILDATDVAAGPVARIHMPRRVPFGFHGTWLDLS